MPLLVKIQLSTEEKVDLEKNVTQMESEGIA